MTDLGGRLGEDIYIGAGSYYPFIVEGGEWYRLLTACFIHSGIDHLAGNMIALGVYGYRLESRLGHVRMLLLYLAAGLASTAGSLFLNHYLGDDFFSIGASGAIFGVLGALIAVLIREGGRQDGVGLAQLVAAAVIMIVIGLSNEHVDQFGHLFGLLAGFLLGGIPSKRKRNLYG